MFSGNVNHFLKYSAAFSCVLPNISCTSFAGKQANLAEENAASASQPAKHVKQTTTRNPQTKP